MFSNFLLLSIFVLFGVIRAFLGNSLVFIEQCCRYTMVLGDLQILVGRVRDNFKYAHQRGTSTLRVVDRFNISLQVVFTTEPQFPSLTVSGNLPRLVVHVNEQKIDALRTMVALISGKGLPSPFR
jgi:vacuolar protein sorting-associated protein 13D